VTWKGFTLAMITVALGLIAINRESVSDLESKIESRVSRDEFAQYVMAQNRWQDRMETAIESVRSAAVQPTNDVTQAQYVLVQLPPSADELQDQRVRDILMLNQRGEP